MTYGQGAPEQKAQLGGIVPSGDGLVVQGYASVFGVADQGGDVVLPGAYAAALARLKAGGGRVRMLWQHDPARPIGVWDEVSENGHGLWAKGRILPDVEQGREAAALLAAGAIDGLSIGYRAVKSSRDAAGHRLLSELELWEISLVTFPMQREARVAMKQAQTGAMGQPPLAMIFDALAAEITLARADLAAG